MNLPRELLLLISSSIDKPQTFRTFWWSCCRRWRTVYLENCPVLNQQYRRCRLLELLQKMGRLRQYLADLLPPAAKANVIDYWFLICDEKHPFESWPLNDGIRISIDSAEFELQHFGYHLSPILSTMIVDFACDPTHFNIERLNCWYNLVRKYVRCDITVVTINGRKVSQHSFSTSFLALFEE